MSATRRTQPYRQGARHPGAALTAMTKGRSLGGHNPMDISRAAHRLVAASKAPGRPGRPPRHGRAPRPPR